MAYGIPQNNVKRAFLLLKVNIESSNFKVIYYRMELLRLYACLVCRLHIMLGVIRLVLTQYRVPYLSAGCLVQARWILCSQLLPCRKQITNERKIQLKWNSDILDTGDLHGCFFKLDSSCSGCACYFLRRQNSKLEIDDRHMHWSILILFHTLHSVQETILILRYSLNSHFYAISLLIFCFLDIYLGNSLYIS